MSSRKPHGSQRPPARLAAYERAYRRLTRQLAALGYVVKGSVQVRSMQCGYAACRCRRAPRFRHGPYYWWTSKVGGKTVTWVLSQEEGKLYLSWARNRQRLEAIVDRLYRLSAKVAQAHTGRPPPILRQR